MRPTAPILAAAIVLTGLAAWAQSPSDAVRKEIEAANQQFVEAFNAGDVERAVGIYTEDAVILPPNMERIEGRDGILRFWQELAETQVSGVELETVSVETQDDMAYEVGEFSLDAIGQDGEAGPIEGKYVVVWKRTDDGWKWHVDIWNMNPPSE